MDIDIVEQMLRNAMSLYDDTAMAALDSQEGVDLVKRLQTDRQMYEQGVNADGEPMGHYAPSSVQIKRIEGQRYDHITGHDTGEMYNSTKVTFLDDGIEIEMQTIKGGKDVNTETEWGKNIVGLTDESIGVFIDEYAEEKIIDATEEWLFKDTD